MLPVEIDLEALRSKLHERFSGMPPAGYVRGKTTLRNAVVDVLSCSQFEAETMVDTLENRGLIRYDGDPKEEIDRREHHWVLER